jgi:hypothetical protein
MPTLTEFTLAQFGLTGAELKRFNDLHHRGKGGKFGDGDGGPSVHAVKAAPDKPGRSRTRKARVPAEAPEPDGVQQARARQADIDRVRARADLIAEAAQLIDYQATPEALAHRLNADARRHGVQDDPAVRKLLAAADAHDMAALGKAMTALGKKLKVQQTAGAGEIAPFDGHAMRHIGGNPQRGTPVHVIRPGFTYTRPDGEQIQVIKADVEQAEPEEIDAFRRARQTAIKGAEPLPPASPSIPRARLRAMTDDQLAARFADISRQDQLDEPALREVIGEMDRREKKPRPRRPTKAQQDLDAQLEQGRDYRSAAAAVIDRKPGETLDAAVRRYHDEWLDLSYLQAEQNTSGHMLSPEGKAARIDPRSLFTGPLTRARKYASEELLRWWADNPRLNRTQFRAQLLARPSDVKAAKATKARSSGRDFI